MTRRRNAWTGLVLVAALALTLGLYWFQPWKLIIDHRVDDALPAVATQRVPGAAVSPDATLVPSTAPASRRPASPALLARGELISHEHDTSGTVSVVRRPDGSRVLAIAHLDTSDGPDVHVWLTDQPVRHGESGWYLFDDGRHVDLGELKGNLGNQLYRIPPAADLSRLTSVSIWCQRFDVSFGAATLTPV